MRRPRQRSFREHGPVSREPRCHAPVRERGVVANRAARSRRLAHAFALNPETRLEASPPVDLRSDTVTRPTPAMRRAIAEAVVGDDVFGDDPTVQALERRVADLAGKEAALFVPSGTMGNQLAVKCLTTPGDEVLLETHSHINFFEQGGIAANSGCLSHPVETERGMLAPEDLAAALRADDDHVARITLACVENTHNWHGGTVAPLDRVRELSAAARARGVRVHLDGARLWNASVATGVPIRDWAATADTVMMCF